MSKKVTHEFYSVTERDRWLDQTYPERVALDAPGSYRVDGGEIGVHHLEVAVYPELPPTPRPDLRHEPYVSDPADYDRTAEDERDGD
jgi:hypothetical protein